MGHIKEPKGVDFYVDSRPLTAEDLHLISEAIAYYKATGRKMRSSSNRNGTLSKRKGKVIKSS
jgi:hypothetical protein